MTILCRTDEYLAEFEAGYLTISRYSDGHCKAWKQSGIAGLFRADLKRFGAERAVEVYLRLMRRAPWEPLYKPERMPGVDAAWDADCGHAFESDPTPSTNSASPSREETSSAIRAGRTAMPKRDDRTDYEKLPKRVRSLIEHCRSGKTLCRGYRPRAIGHEDQVVAYWLEPGGKAAPRVSSQEAIDKGYLSPLDAGLFGDGNAQSYGAVADLG